MWRRFELLLVGLMMAWGASGDGLALWSATPDESSPSTRVRAVVRFDLPAASVGDLPLPPSGARGGLARVQKEDGRCAYCGWAAGGWVELAGREAGADPVEAEMVFCEGTVVYRVDGVMLTEVSTGASRLACTAGDDVRNLGATGEGRIVSGDFSGSCLDAVQALTEAKGRVVVTDATPDGVYPLLSEQGAEWRTKISIEGPTDRLCSLAPAGNDGLDVQVGPLPYDDGRHVLNVTLAPQAVGFIHNLSDEQAGIDHQLYLNGGGRLVLQGASRISGGVVVEDGIVEVQGQSIDATSSDVLLWAGTAFAVASTVDRLELTERVTTATDSAGQVVRRVAFAPKLTTPSEAGEGRPLVLDPTVTTDGFRTVVFRIANATKGFSYGCASSSTLGGDFVPCAASIVADQDGALELTVRVPAAEPQRFFRLHVGLPLKSMGQ